MNLVSLTEYIVKSLVKNPDDVKININEDNDIKIVQVLVNKNDISSLIGKNGVLANAIRTIVQASSYHNNLGKVRINIDTI